MALIAEEISTKHEESVHELDSERLSAAMAAALPARSAHGRRPRRLLIAAAAGAALLVGAVIISPRFGDLGGKVSHLTMASRSLDLQQPDSYNYAVPSNKTPAGVEEPVSSGAAGIPMQRLAPGLRQSDLPANAPSVGPSDVTLERQVHKSATITVQVSDPETSGEQVEEVAKTAGGFVTTSDLTTSADGTKSYTLTVKVPLPQFEMALSQIAKFGTVQDKEVTGEDITDQVSDADQREAVLEEDMNQALDQLRKKGSHASWDLQEDARDLRVQLAQSRARLQLLRGMAELSEIDVTLAQPPKPTPAVQSGFFSDISSSAGGALESASGAVATLIALFFWILAYAPLWLPAILVGRWIWRHYNGDGRKLEG